MWNILVAEPNKTLLFGITSILNSIPDFTVSGEAEHRHDIFVKLRTNPVDLIVLEPLLGGATGEGLIKQVRSYALSTPIVALTSMNEFRHGVQTIKAGVNGFVRKDCSREELVFAVRRTLLGKQYISHELSEHLLMGLHKSNKEAPHEILTERELDVCTRLVNGERVCDIALKLSISVKTVSTHKTRAFKKMKVTNFSALVRLFVDNGYVKIDESIAAKLT